MLAESGVLNLANNWSKTGWRNSFEGGFDGAVTGGSSMVIGTSPGFADAAAQDYRLISGSPAINAGTTLLPDALPSNNVIMQYLKHLGGESRPVSGVLDIGAYEFAAAAPLQIDTANLEDAIRLQRYSQILSASGGSGNFVWSISAGSLPAGLWLDPSSGIIYGRGRLRGTSNFTLTVTDLQSGLTASRVYSVQTRLY